MPHRTAARPNADPAPELEGVEADVAWAAFLARDRNADGRFVVAVTSTGIYCRPSCPARRPARSRVRLFRDGDAAVAAGFRPCLRCRPDAEARDRVAVAEAIAAIEAAETPPALADLAAAVGYAPHHFQRLFKRATGVSPAVYARGVRARRAAAALADESRVTDAIYAAGYAAPSRFYAMAGERLGMAPRAWRQGGAGETIRWVRVPTSLGPLLVAATARGLCRVSFDEDEAALGERFPGATIEPGDDALRTLAEAVVAQVERPGATRDRDLPLDVRGTAFQEAVWAALRAIPAGESRSYSELAAAIGRPRAVRAVGTACGANPVGIVIPCHRAQRGDGSMAGYAWGIDRKVTLRRREGLDRGSGAPETADDDG